MSELADLLAGADDLGAWRDALAREQAIRSIMEETGERREIVAEQVDAADAMGEEAVLDLTEGQPTTLADALRRYVDELEKRDPDGNELIPVARVVAELGALLDYSWRGDEARLALHDANASLRLNVRDNGGSVSVLIGGNRKEVYRTETYGNSAVMEAVTEATHAVHQAVLARVIADRDHHVQLNNTERLDLMNWLEWPNGSWDPFGSVRLSIDAVAGGGILVRTRPYQYQPAPETRS